MYTYIHTYIHTYNLTFIHKYLQFTVTTFIHFARSIYVCMNVRIYLRTIFILYVCMYVCTMYMYVMYVYVCICELIVCMCVWLGQVHQLVVRLKDAIQETANREITQQVAARFEKKTKVLDTNTFFVKQVRSYFTLTKVFLGICTDCLDVCTVCMYACL